MISFNRYLNADDRENGIGTGNCRLSAATCPLRWVLQMEQDYDKALLLREVFQPLLSVDEEENALIDRFKDGVADDGKSIVLITGVGKSFPIIRSHTILNNLQSVFRRNPVVMMYPGRYEIKEAMTLRLFERLDDDNYYRAFPLVERRATK